MHCLGRVHRTRVQRQPGVRPTFWETWGYPTWPTGKKPNMIGPCRKRLGFCKFEKRHPTKGRKYPSIYLPAAAIIAVQG